MKANYLKSFMILSIFLSMSLFCVSVQAEVTEPSARDKNITILVTAMMQKQHLSQRPIDAEIAERTISNLLKGLDPQKLYFYQSDVDYFRAQQPNLGVEFRKGNLRLAYVLFKTYLERVDERNRMMEEALSLPIDLTVDEEMVTDPDLLTYPRNAAEARERIRKRVKYDLLILQMNDIRSAKKAANAADSESSTQSDTTPAAEETPKTPEEKHQANVETLRKRYARFAKRMHQTDNDELLEIYLSAMASAFDPHSSYMSPSTEENFRIIMGLHLQGIGATLSSDDNGFVVVKALVTGGAAEKEGSLKVDDKICGVGQGEDGPIEDIVDMKLDDVVKKVRGEKDTIVRLEVIPADGGPKKIVKITRAEIKLTDSAASGEVFEAGKKADGTPWRIGVVNLPSFYLDMEGARRLGGNGDYRSSTRDVKVILERFNQEKVDAVVVDLRMNGGGSLIEAINLTGLFIDLGTVVQVKGPNGQEALPDETPGVTWNGPLVVVINKLSASASEILAGAIQDYGRGLIIGDKTTHGKGTVQTVAELGRTLFVSSSPLKLGSLKVSIQQFYRPLGASTQNRGVESDVEIPSITTYMDIGEADLDYALPFDQIDPQPIKKWGTIPSDLILSLRERSAQRVAESSDFQKLIKKINFYRSQKDRTSVTLNAQKFMDERADVLNEEEENLAEKDMRGANTIQRDFYLDEVLNITTDFAGTK